MAVDLDSKIARELVNPSITFIISDNAASHQGLRETGQELQYTTCDAIPEFGTNLPGTSEIPCATLHSDEICVALSNALMNALFLAINAAIISVASCLITSKPRVSNCDAYLSSLSTSHATQKATG